MSDFKAKMCQISDFWWEAHSTPQTPSCIQGDYF